MTAVAAAVPLAFAPLLFASAHSSLALDAGLLCAALVGGMRTVNSHTRAAAFVRLPIALLLVYGMMQAVRYGAWPLAVCSLLTWVVGMLWHGKRDHA